MKKIKVGQLIDCYLRTTENWCYRLLRHLPDAELQVITTTVRNEGRFQLPAAELVAAPLAHLCGRDLGGRLGRLVSRLQLVLLAPWRLEVIWRARSLSLLHAHFANIGWNYQWLVKARSLPLVVSYYGFDYEWMPRAEPVWRERYRELFESAQLFLTEGEFGRRTLISMGCPAEKVRVLHLGVEPKLIPFYRRTRRPGSLRLIQIATFTGKKGHDTTLRAFAKALQSCPGITLTLVGRDPEGIRHLSERLIDSLGIREQVTMVDGVDFARLHEILAEYDVFIHPSRYSESGDSEGGAPVVLLDAQATGMPIISTTHCDIPDEVLDGVTGLLAPEGDFEAVARHIERFYLMEDDEYRRFSEAARRHVEEEYDATTSARRLRDLYQEVLDKKAGLLA